MSNIYWINEDLNVLSELLQTFYYLANEEAKIKSLESSLDNYNLDKDKYLNKNLKSFFKFIDIFKKESIVSDDKIKFYFKDINTCANYNSDCLASLLLSNVLLEDIDDIHSTLSNMKNSDLESILIREIVNNLDGDSNPDLYQNISNKDDFTKYLIDNNNLTFESKWSLTLLINDCLKYFLELLEILNTSKHLFFKAFKHLEKDRTIFIAELKKCFDEDENFFSNITGIDFDFTDKLVIYPSMINFKSVTITVKSDKFLSVPKRDCCYFGWKFKELIELSKNSTTAGILMQDKLKCISDKSKFEILKLLKIEPMYGQQIADKLQLTTATISHHMNNLVLNKFIYVNKVDNRVYYNLDKNQLENFIINLKEELI